MIHQLVAIVFIPVLIALAVIQRRARDENPRRDFFLMAVIVTMIVLYISF
jgi:hypothetical protein